MSSAARFQQSFDAMLAAGAEPVDPALRRAVLVHRNTSLKAALDALEANFPVLARLVGPESFSACALAYVERDPPADPCLCEYGGRFAAHVANWPPFRDYPYLGPIARLDRMALEALFAADAEGLDPALIVTALDAGAGLRLHPATRIARFDYPVVSLWRAHGAADEPNLDDLVWEPEIALVTRPRLAVAVNAIDEPTLAFLSAQTLGAGALAAHDAGGDVAKIFASLLIAGAFA